MKAIKPIKNRFVTRREAVLRQIAGIGPFIEGTLVKVPRKDCRHVAHRLTYKVDRKTHAVYVPLERVKDVELAEIGPRFQLRSAASFTFYDYSHLASRWVSIIN